MRAGPGARLAVLAVLALLTGCSGAAQPSGDASNAARQIQQAVAAGLPTTKTIVLGTVPHAPEGRTEGLEIYDGLLYESTTLPGHAELRELDPATGRVIRAAQLPPGLDAGGITVVGSLIWQLAHPGDIALQWNRETLNAGGRVPWTPHARGLCHDESRLYGSDGSNLLRLVDRDSGFRTDKVLDVRLQGAPLAGLDELECLRGRILANVTGTTWIVSIDSKTGVVLSASDLAEVLPAEVRGDPAKSLNGVALLPGTDTFLVTGNFWPTMLRVRFGL